LAAWNNELTPAEPSDSIFSLCTLTVRRTGGKAQRGDQTETGTGACETKSFVWISELKQLPVHFLIDMCDFYKVVGGAGKVFLKLRRFSIVYEPLTGSLTLREERKLQVLATKCLDLAG
jgi:hypothetical protein